MLNVNFVFSFEFVRSAQSMLDRVCVHPGFGSIPQRTGNELSG
jgi:hypothetical protein